MAFGSSIGSNGDAVYVPILPSFNDFFDEMAKKSTKAGKDAGDRISRGIEAGVEKAQRAVDKSADAQTRALNRAADAAGKTEVAFARLTEVQDNAGAKQSQIVKATQDYEKAKRDEEAALARAEKATANYEKAQRDLNVKTTEAANASKAGADAVSGFGDAARAARGDVDGLGSAAGGLGSRIMDGVKTVGKGALLGVGAKIGTTMMEGVSTAIGSGFARLQNIEQAETMLAGLGHEASAIEGIMDNAMASVKGTAFGFGDAASAAATFIGAGVAQGADLERVLTLVGDTAAITGTSFGEMGAIWSKVAGNQKLTTMELNQLLDRGLGLLPELQEKYGVTAEEARKMISEGKVSFEDFSDVMETMVGGSAQKMGDTFAGSAANMKAALGRLGAQLLQPVFENAPAIFKAVQDAVDELGVALEPAIKAFSEWLGPVMKDIAENIGPVLTGTIRGVVDVIGNLFGFIQRNKDTLAVLGSTAAGAAGGLAMMHLQMKIAAAGGFVKWLVSAVNTTKLYTGVTKGAAAAQKIFNTVLRANPIGLIVTALLAVGAALAVFFTKTETGREMWASFMGFVRNTLDSAKAWFAGFSESVMAVVLPVWDALKAGWDGLSAAIEWAWTNILQPIWDGMKVAAQVLAQVLLTVLIAPLMIAWNVMSVALQAAWTNVIKPMFDGFAAVATWLWQNVLVPAFDGIRASFEWLGTVFSNVWTTVIKPVWDGLAAVIQWFWDNVGSVYLGFIRDGWAALGAAFTWTWENVIKPVWDAMAAAAQWLWNNVLMPTFDGIKAGFGSVGDAFMWVWENVIRPAWDGLGNGIRWVVDNVVTPAFNKIGEGLDRVKGWFQTAVDAIRNIWDGVRSATAKPIRFVVDTVFNKGIKKAWNAVAKFTGLKELEPVSLGDLGNYRRGGILPGYTPGRDPYEFIEPRTGMRIGLSGGEAIVRPEATRVLGSSWVDGINAAARLGGAPAVSAFLDEDRKKRAYAAGGVINLGNFAAGGVVDSIVGVVKKNFPMMTITSTVRPGDPGWHGKGKAVDFSNGTDTTPQMQAAARFFHQNYGPGLLELIHFPLSGWQNIKNGKPLDYGPATNAGHRNHVHVAAPAPLGDPKIMVEMLADGGGGGFFDVGAHVKKLWDGIVDKLPKWDGPGLIGELPAAMLKKMAESAWDFIKSKVGAFFGNAGQAGSAESWREMAMAAMRRNGFNADDPAQVNAMLKQIMSESGGNPGIAQQIVDINGTGESAGVGLLQIIPGTFAAYRDPSLPNDRRDPWANMNAALRYYRARYGDDLTKMWGHGHGYASGGVLPGFTPGRDIHEFFSPTGGLLALSGGESIMVPEWTRSVGGPQAVEAMNKAARRGRFSASSSYGFANGGTYGEGARFWQPVADRRADALASALGAAFGEQLDKAIQPVINELQIIANPNTYEGIAARAAVGQAAEIMGLVGLDRTGDLLTFALGQERELLEYRKGYEARIAAIVEKEEALAAARESLSEARKAETEMSDDDKKKIADAEEALADARKAGDAQKVADAEKALSETREEISKQAKQDAETRAENISKANDQVAKAEADLADARKEAASHLDMLVYDVFPGLHDTLMSASVQVRSYVPQAADALVSLAAAAGPAGMSVGQVIAVVKQAIKIVTKIVEVIDRIVGSIFAARVAAAEALHDSVSAMREYADLVGRQQQMVADLQNQLVRAAIAQTKAAMDARNATAAMVRARLEGDRQVADARAALELELQAEMRRSRRDYRDLAMAYDRYRYGEYKAMEDRLSWQMKLTPELAALQLEVDAAEMTRMANIQRATMEAIEASYAHRNAARAAKRASEDLNRAAETLAMMTGKTFGLDQTEAYVGEEVARLYAERAKLQAELSSVKNNLSAVWRWGGGKEGAESSLRAVNARIAELESRPEFAGYGISKSEIEELVKKAQTLHFFGREEDAKRLFEGSALGNARRALDSVKFEQGLASIKDEIRDASRSREDLVDEVALEEQVRPLRDSASALDSAAASAKYRAESLRAEDPAVADALRTLADFERENALDIQRVSRGEPSRIELSFTDKAAYSAAEVDALLEKLGSLDGIELRVKKLESAAAPGPADLMRLRAR